MHSNASPTTVNAGAVARDQAVSPTTIECAPGDWWLHETTGGPASVEVTGAAFTLSAEELTAVLYVAAGGRTVQRHEVSTARDVREVVCTELLMAGYCGVNEATQAVWEQQECGQADTAWLDRCRRMVQSAFNLSSRCRPVAA